VIYELKIIKTNLLPAVLVGRKVDVVVISIYQK